METGRGSSHNHWMMTISLKPRRFFFEYTQAGLVAVIFALFVRTFLVQPFTIPSPSMEDTLLVGDYILVNKFALASLASPLERADRDGVRAAGRHPSPTKTSRLLTSAGAFFTGTRWDRSGRLIR